MGSKGVGLIVILLLVAGGWWAANKISGQHNYWIATAFGVPHKGDIEMNAIVSRPMADLEPPRVDPETFKVLWQEWTDRDFELRDASGMPVKITFRESTDRCIIPTGKIVGAPVGYILARLKQGTNYTFDYIPKFQEPEQYQHAFTAPTGDTSVARLPLELP